MMGPVAHAVLKAEETGFYTLSKHREILCTGCTYTILGLHVCAQRLFTGHQRTVQETKTYM